MIANSLTINRTSIDGLSASLLCLSSPDVELDQAL